MFRKTRSTACPPNLAPPCHTDSAWPNMSSVPHTSSWVLHMFRPRPKLALLLSKLLVCFVIQCSNPALPSALAVIRMRSFLMLRSFLLSSSLFYLSCSQVNHRCTVSSHPGAISRQQSADPPTLVRIHSAICLLSSSSARLPLHPFPHCCSPCSICSSLRP